MKRYITSILLVVLIVGGIFGVSCTKSPNAYQIALNDLTECETRLGETNQMGEFYTLREFGHDIARLTEPIPDFLITKAEGFSDLVLFYKRAEMSWEEYNRLPLGMESTIALVAEELYGSDGYWLAGVLWSQYDELPSTPTSVRTKYRLNHPEVDALLLFWGKSTKSVFHRGTKEGEGVSNLLLTWFKDYEIDKRMHPLTANWTLITEKEWLEMIEELK